MENDGIRDISPLGRVQRVKESARRRKEDGGRKGRRPGRQPADPPPEEPPPADEGSDAEDPPSKGSRLDIVV